MPAFQTTTPSPTGLQLDDTATAFAYKSTDALKRGYLLFRSIGVPALAKLGPRVVNRLVNWGLPVRGLVRRYFFDQFCGGHTLDEALGTAKTLYAYGVQATLDYAVEAQKTKAGYDRCQQEVMRAIDAAQALPEVGFVAIKVTGLGNIHALTAAQSGAMTTPDQAEFDAMALRLDQICRYAAERNQAVLIDAEESWIQGMIDKLAEDMMLAYNDGRAIVYTTLQMYRHDRLAYLDYLTGKFADHNRMLGIKLVRGAYLEKENLRAKEKGYPTPMQPNKAATDAAFDQAARHILAHHSYMALCAGTHNELSCLRIAEEMQRLALAPNHPHVAFSQLYGMSDHISFNLAAKGYQVAKYLPYGPLEETMPYLFRRAEENTSIAGQSSRELRLISQELQRRKAARR
jgi:proline dehydrogenase